MMEKRVAISKVIPCRSDIPTSIRGEKKPLYMMKEIIPIEEVIHTKTRQYNGN